MDRVIVPTGPLKYQHIRAELLAIVRSGKYQVGDKLPSESALVEAFNASRSTVIRALRDVEDEGLIERRQGAGSFVTAKARHQAQPVRTTIGLLRKVQSGRFPDSVVDQVQNRLSALLQRRGSALVVHTIEKDEPPLAIARQLLDRRLDGLFMVPIPPDRATDDANRAVTDFIATENRPLVLLDGDIVCHPHRSAFDVVGIENHRGGYVQTRHLLDAGLTRILFLNSAPPSPTTTERHFGYVDAMAGAGIDVPPGWTCAVASDEIDEAFVVDLVKRLRPEAIVCKSDEFAALLMRHLPAAGVRVPDDLMLVGFDDRPIASLLPVTLTTVRQPVAEIAEAALALLDDRIARPTRAAARIQFAGELVVRQSTSR